MAPVAPTCDRCFREDQVVTTMSRFNTQVCCMDCIAEEKQHPDWPHAFEVEEKAVKAGNTKHPGVGLPADLRQKMFDKIVEKKLYKELFHDAVWGDNDGYLFIDESGAEKCVLCLEPIKKKSFRISDVGESMEVCFPCAKIFVAYARKTIEAYIKESLTPLAKDIAKEIVSKS